MNKQVLILMLCLSAAVLADDDFFPRRAHLCDDKQGYFWDGQKCEVCARSQPETTPRVLLCTCSTYNGCDSCPDGYSLYQPSYSATEQTPLRSCFPCQSPFSSASRNQDLIQKLIKQCCFDQEGNDIDITLSSYSNSNFKTKAMRAQVCRDSYLGSKISQFGHVCYYLEGCNSYTDYGKCTTCIDGYYLDNKSTCTKCIDNCKVCLTQSQCSICADSYYLQVNNPAKATFDPTMGASSCQPCSPGCLCSGTNQNLCDNCQDGFYFSNGTCNLCSTTIPHCKQCSDQQTCVTCSQNDNGTGMYYQINPDKQCEECPPNCHKCTYNTTLKKTECDSDGCENGYYRDQDSSNRWTCTQCSGSFVSRCDFVATGKPPKITQCGLNIAVPDRTIPPHSKQIYLLGGDSTTPKCVQNKNNCKKIVDSSGDDALCETCYTDKYWVLHDAQKTCLQCTSEQGHCQPDKCSYDSTRQKIICQQGFCLDGYFSDTASSCTPCQVNFCKTCQSGATCSTCYDQYYLANQNQECRTCLQNCITCTTSDSCQTCKIGYTPTDSNKSCIQCDDVQCQDCNGNRQVCKTCNANFFVQNGSCIPARSNCINYSKTGGACQSCDYGFRIVEGICFPCMNVGLGYVNCAIGCTSTKYMRDGDQLTPDFTVQSITSSNANKLAIIFAVLCLLMSILM